MANSVTGLSFSPGYITLLFDNGTRTQYPVADILRALDIPTGLTYQQVSAITTLANLVVVLVRTLVAKEVIDENFLEEGEFDLGDIIESIEDMGGDYGEPDISVA